MITHGMKISGAALLGFTLFACGTSTSITQGTVVSVKADPGHWEKKKCKAKTRANCKKNKNTWDDADYELELSDGKHTSWVEVDDSAIFAACPVGVKYPACATSVS